MAVDEQIKYSHRWDELSIGDTALGLNGHEQMWDGGQWVHSPDCACRWWEGPKNVIE